jgi:hypothetical protein
MDYRDVNPPGPVQGTTSSFRHHHFEKTVAHRRCETHCQSKDWLVQKGSDSRGGVLSSQGATILLDSSIFERLQRSCCATRGFFPHC